MKRYLSAFLLSFSLLTFGSETAEPETSQLQETWGLGAVFRSAQIPFGTEENHVHSFVPMLFYRGEHFFLNGIEGGLDLYRDPDLKLELSVLGRLRFYDIPKDYQNQIQGDNIDWGVRLRKFWGESFYTDLESLSDSNSRYYINAKAGYKYSDGRLDLEPSLTLNWKSSRFNDYYYGLEEFGGDAIGSGTAIKLGLSARYHVYSNLYLLANTELTFLDEATRDSIYTDRDYYGELFFGIGFFNEPLETKAPTHDLPHYVRIAHGFATPSNLGEIFSFNTESDGENNQLTSIFYGYPLADELFSLPLEIYLTPGFVGHWSSDVQQAAQEYVLAIKAYYTFQWPFRWRFGVAEGISYISHVSYIEAIEMERKGYEPSKLMNYLDFSFDLNVGDLFNRDQWDHIWFGWSVHHRSSIFEKASHFGRIKGGSNYNTVYLQFDF